MKKNGFVFIETIVVISVLSITLLLLFSSYSYILRKSRERDTFDNIDLIYKTFYVKDIIDKYKIGKAPNVAKSSIMYYIENNSECKKMSSFNSYVCDLSSDTYNGILFQAKTAFEVEKIYLLNPGEILNSSNKVSWLTQFDATTIDYIDELGIATNKQVLVVKYKKVYNDGTYEMFHSSIEV